ncbi:Abi family protein [Mycetocola saprophilus]|uniref:Abi family protein n=1 Tax=Mycetocola saprophilus TaxID=76636 RepID=UPI003BF2EB7E
MDKSFRSLTELRQILLDRGLTLDGGAVVDVVAAEKHLYNVNYFRFSGNARQFQPDRDRGNESFLSGTRYSEIQEIIRRDEQLRLLLFEGLSVAELVVRARFAHEAASRFGEGAFYLEEGHYLAITPDVLRHIDKIRSELMRPNIASVARYRVGDDLSKVPIWVAIEHVSFGALAKMVGYFRDSSAAKIVSEKLSVPWGGFHNTIHSFAVLRNICAHHGQIWNRRVGITAPVQWKLKRFEPRYDNGSVYATVIMLKQYVRMIDSRSDWPGRVDEFFRVFPVFAQGVYRPNPR